VAIPQLFIQDLLERTDVVEVVGRYVQLKKAGANFVGLCPFHAEKTPSFSVSQSKQFYHCFGCGKSGNAIGFLMEMTGAGFLEVVQGLAQQYGLEVPDDRRGPAEREQEARAREARARLAALLAQASAAYSKLLRSSRAAIGYLKRRGLSGAIARDFGLGWAPDGWQTLAEVFSDYESPLLVEAGLVIAQEGPPARRYDRFRQRVMFPIRGIRGDVIGFGGRVLDDSKPKYLNSSDGTLFHKGRELYGLFEARRAVRERGYALVTEGYMDVVALAQSGFLNAVATLGTACTPEHVQKLFRFTDQIVFSFDGDAAGRAAAHKALNVALPYAEDTRTLKFLFLPPEHDPDSFVRSQGVAAFQEQVDRAIPLSRFLIDAAAEQCAMDTAEGRSHFAAKARELWQRLPDGALGRQLLGDIATRVQLDVQELERLWGLSGAADRRPAPASVDVRDAAPAPARPTPSIRASSARSYPSDRTAARALQIVLTASESWLALSSTDHQLLCDMPTPYGPLFAWVERQLQESGPQTWPVFRSRLTDQALAEVAEDLVRRIPAEIKPEASELESILRAQRPSYLKKRMNAALAEGNLGLYRVLLADYTAAKK
jgi:DNA primase